MLSYSVQQIIGQERAKNGNSVTSSLGDSILLDSDQQSVSATGGSNSLAAALGVGYVWDYTGHLYKQDFSDELIKSRKSESINETSTLFKNIYMHIEKIRHETQVCYRFNNCSEVRSTFDTLDELMEKAQNSDQDRLGIIAQLQVGVIAVAGIFVLSIFFRESAGLRDFFRTRIRLYLQMI